MLLIKNGILYTMEGNDPLRGVILIDNGKIVEISEQINVRADMEIFDAEGLNVFPGFIDAHSHIGISEENCLA